MRKTPFMPKDDPGKCQWLNNFTQKLPAHAGTVGVTPAEVASTQADNAYFTWVCNAKELYANAAKEWTPTKLPPAKGSGQRWATCLLHRISAASLSL
ncbi:MAG: hypothetical protein HY043_18090 [Verrucomicrobia bacterium]|nr:hypothetical protein [Verrucomicrobiota bacterium]